MRPPVLCLQAFVLDSDPGILPMDAERDVDSVLKQVERIPLPVPSRQWLLDHMQATGFSMVCSVLSRYELSQSTVYFLHFLVPFYVFLFLYIFSFLYVCTYIRAHVSCSMASGLQIAYNMLIATTYKWHCLVPPHCLPPCHSFHPCCRVWPSGWAAT